MARKINYRVRFQLAGGAIVTKVVQATSYMDMVKRVNKVYKGTVLSAQEVQ